MKNIVGVLIVLCSVTVSAQSVPTIERTFGSVAVAGTLVTACTSPAILMYNNITFTVRNTGTAVLTNCTVSQSADGTNFDVISSSWSACKELAAGAQTSWSISGNSYKYLRIQVAAAAAPNNTTVVCSMVGSSR